MYRVGFATYGDMPQLSDDDALALPELHRMGIDVSPIIWDRQAAIPDDVGAIVIRSCWNYHLNLPLFLRWIDQLNHAGMPLFNVPHLVRWNVDKRYLRDLAAQGVVIPQTVWVEPGQQRNLSQILTEHDIDEAVIKPAVSLSAYQTWRTSRSTSRAHQAAFESLAAERAVLVQSFIPQVTTDGELSFVFFRNQYSHTVRKVPKAGDFRVQADYGASRAPVVPPRALIEQAQQIVALVNEPLLFARVDGVAVDGRLVLMELELIDPVLFLTYDDAAPRRFAEAVAHELHRSR